MDISQELESFYKDKHEEILGKVGLIKGWWGYLLLFLLPLIVINFKPFFIEKTFEFTTFVISLFFSALTTFIAKTFIQYKISITRPKTFAPEQFEKIFNEAIRQLTSSGFTGCKWIKRIKNIVNKQSRLEKIVIAIDNIDRCNNELALELLLTIKNFLEIPGVVFIIPVDEDGIKKYLKLSDRDANEFLRKLFNTTIRIKKFSANDLFNFCMQLNEWYGLGFSGDVLSIVEQEFTKNPRRIIQFLNNLQCEVLLAKKIEEAGLVEPKGVITNNLPMLAKLLILREEWPDLYKKISDDPDLLKRITQGIKEEKFKREDDSYKLEEGNITLTTEQYRFLVRTSSVSTDKLEPFLINRDVFSDIPDGINELVLSQDWDTIKEKYLNKGIIYLSRLVAFISKKLDQDVIKRHLFSTSGFNLLALIFKIANDKKYEAELKHLYAKPSFEKIITVCNMKRVENLIFEFNSEELIKFAKWLYDKGERGLLYNIVVVIKGIPQSKMEEKQINIMKTFINVFQNYPKELEKIRDAFSQLLVKNPQLVNEFKEVLKDRSISDSLVTVSLTENFLNSLKGDLKQDSIREKVELLNTLCENEYLSEKEINALYIEKIIQFANTNDWTLIDFWFSTLKIPFEKISNDIYSELVKKIYDLLSNRYQWLYSQYNVGQISEINIRVYKSFMDLCVLLSLITDEYNASIIQWLNNFFERNENSEIYLYINNLYSKIVDKFKVYNWPFSQQIITRFVNAVWLQKKEFANILNKMLLKTTSEKGLNQQQINTILERYLNIAKLERQSEQSTEAKKWIKAVMKNKVIKEQMRVKISNINNSQEILVLLDVVLELKDKVLVQEITNKILLQTPCENIKSIFETLLNKKIDTETVRQAIKERINQLDIEKNAQHRNDLSQFIDLKEIINEELSEIIIDKLKPLLASNNKENELFALKSLDNLEKLPPDRKDLLKVLLKGINSDKWQNEEKDLLDKINKRIE